TLAVFGLPTPGFRLPILGIERRRYSSAWRTGYDGFESAGRNASRPESGGALVYLNDKIIRAQKDAQLPVSASHAGAGSRKPVARQKPPKSSVVLALFGTLLGCHVSPRTLPELPAADASMNDAGTVEDAAVHLSCHGQI